MSEARTTAVHQEGDVAFLEGDLTLAQATRMLALCKASLEQGVRVLDLSRVGHMDSSAISLILSLRRFAQARGHDIQIRALSEDLLSLARLYGVAEHL